MKKHNYLGFTLVELLAVIVVLAIILAIAVPGISGIIRNSTKSAFESDAKMVLKAIEYKTLENNDFDPLTLTKANIQQELKISGDNYAQVVLSYVGDQLKVILVGSGKWDGLTAYGTFKTINVVDSASYDEVPPIITVLGTNPLTIDVGSTYTDAGATAFDLKDGDLTANIIATGTVNANLLGTYTITYTVRDSNENETSTTRTVNVIKSGNPPVLATGMTPIKWNGSAWVTTTENDNDWYSYTATDKKWANAMTADGSMWVWIPRYIYKISSGWHTNTVGTLDVKFSIGTDDTIGGMITLDTGTTSEASNNKWTNHPAFTFDTTELDGIWVAKFEAGGTAAAIDIKPSVLSLRSLTVGAMFTASRNMETNTRYGWGTSGTNIDTHLMKNTEWGAAAYLSQSIYGINGEIWINPANNYTTGCAGDSATSSTTTGCLRTYDTTNGTKASTTGNIYGIYDMSGGASDYVSAYINNNVSNLATYASVIVSADAKYKDVYTKATTDSSVNNYDLAINLKGDAVYETSNTSTWNVGYREMPYGNDPIFTRGGWYGATTNASQFSFQVSSGYAISDKGFRPVLLVGAGL